MNLILDFFRTTFESEFQTMMNGERIAIGLLVSFFLSLYIIFVYRITYQGVSFQKNFMFSLLLISMVTSVVIMTVTTNLALSLGMVGALSIVRFRTAVKDPTDTVFMFWAISVGIMAGAGLIYVSVITNVCLGLLYLLFYYFNKNTKASSYLLVIRYQVGAGENVNAALASMKKISVKSKSVTSGVVELSLETKLTPETLSFIEDISKMEGVLDAGAVSYGNNTSL
ncbi:MAG: DUF4956 domain-containing protein [Clostridia bacterium]|nr:DUF4956 domain-containing protein [Clostridia bacterium]